MKINRCLKSLTLFGSLLLLPWAAHSQDRNFASLFQEAIRLDEENETSEAMRIWTILARQDPDNGNVNYRAGRAYLNSYNQKQEALPFLRRAVKDGVDPNYDPLSHQQTKPPVEAYYYLARSYHLHHDFDHAQEYYELFITEAKKKHHLQEDAALGLTQTVHARHFVENPLEFEIENLGSVINSEYPDYSPVISIDENALFFTSRRLRADSSNVDFVDRETGGYFEDIYVSFRDRRGEWQEPEMLGLNTQGHNATMNVSPDGQTLYIYRDDAGDGNIYESRLVGEEWTQPVKMGESINSPHWETHIAVTADGNTAYFISNRPGGIGGRDIWQVKKLPTGEWSEALNLGPTLNTPYEEDAVFISPDERTLYFSSQGHTSMGGFDIFSSVMDENGVWSEPKNIGYPINTADDDVFFVTSADGKRGYYSSVRDDGYGEKDIYMINLPEPREVRLALLRGEIIPATGTTLPDNITVYVTDAESGERFAYTPRSRDGVFVAIIPPCRDYLIEYVIDGELAGEDSFSVDCESAYQEINKELLLNPALVDEDGRVVVISSSKGEGEPADFKRIFGYNENIVELEEEMFVQFIANVKAIMDAKGQVILNVEGSASKVPTRTYGNNQKLADLRAENTKQRIIRYVERIGGNPEKLVFETVEGKVQGPAYRGDYQAVDKYKQYQYVKIHAR